ncbi:hypothetical protein [Xenorhabdus szentirmaii]|uniref:hypothetical protein n=1 Tax=Xenorhabdus szentirmaii TaxID=290112 RepID=UPI0012EB9894|nr:hypothetical protein [Xenorhabdus szentirmaii]
MELELPAYRESTGQPFGCPIPPTIIRVCEGTDTKKDASASVPLYSYLGFQSQQ